MQGSPQWMAAPHFRQRTGLQASACFTRGIALKCNTPACADHPAIITTSTTKIETMATKASASMFDSRHTVTSRTC